ncbi:MAG TPA: zinc ribbon domain-containing protein [Candidatus Limnocylindrales bacterium]|nr:zinc ribbon domain-containing protein [Candidatus Limnocylindrales bacterium]
MAGYTPFTNNYGDLSDENGYQFEFRCDICASGYRSEFIRSNLGTVGNLLSGASSIVGGFFNSAANAADRVKDITDRGARDEALEKAANEIMPLFTRCPRCNSWVDETCWNEARGLCTRDAPKLATELEAERAAVEIQQMREAMAQETVFSGDTSARSTVCTSCGKPVGSEKFCSNCGTPTGQNKCPQCGADLPAGARFCGNCGTKSA